MTASKSEGKDRLQAGVADLKRLASLEVLLASVLYVCALAHPAYPYKRPLGLLSLLAVLSEVLVAPQANPFRNAPSGMYLISGILPVCFGFREGATAYFAFLVVWLCGVLCQASYVVYVQRRAAPAVVLGLAALAYRLRLSPTVDAVPAACCGVVSFVVVLAGLPRTFTPGEAVLCSQFWALICAIVLHFHAIHLTKLRMVMIIGCFGAVVISVAVVTLARLGAKSYVIYTSVVGGIVATFWMMSDALGENSFVWLWGYLTSHYAAPLYFLVYYAVVVVVGVASAPATFSHRTIARKYFHLLALVMFVPTILLHLRFLSLALSVAFSVFVVVESLRIAKVEPVHSAVMGYMATYADARDLEGAAILTHIYLLLGCAAPVWYSMYVHHGGIYSAKSLLTAMAGVAITGLGDACASVIGKTFGRWKWHGTNKTVEGFSAMLLSIVLFQTFFLWLTGFDNIGRASWAQLLLGDLLVCLLESSTSQIDNLVLPLFHIAWLQML